MNYPTLRAILILLSVILIAIPAEGYFKRIDNDGLDDRKLSETIAVSKKHGHFIPAVYKNISQSTNNIFNDTILANRSDFLTELIEIDCRHIQPHIQFNTLESSRFIENLIYANLRIQRLIEQYNILHEDAEYFQKAYLHPIKDDTGTEANEINKSDSSLATSDLNRLTFEYDLLKRQFASTSKIADTRGSVKSDNPNSTGNMPVAVREHTSSFQTFAPKRFDGAYKPRLSQKREAAQPQEKTDADENIDNRERRPPIRTNDMPWMIRFVVSTVDYFIHNKVEGLIYLGMMVFVVSALAGGRR